MEAVEIAPASEWERLAAAYCAMHDEALHWAVRITRDRAAAEDVVQDAFVQVFSRVRPLPDDDKLRPYLRRAVVNAALSRLRTDRRQRAREARSWSPTNEGSSRDEELWERVRLLPRRQFTVIALRYWLDQSEVDTARLMRCRVGTVKSLTARAVATLRKELGDG